MDNVQENHYTYEVGLKKKKMCPKINNNHIFNYESEVTHLAEEIFKTLNSHIKQIIFHKFD